MSSADVDRDIEETLGLVPTFFQHVPDYLIESEWLSFKNLQLAGFSARREPHHTDDPALADRPDRRQRKLAFQAGCPRHALGRSRPR